MKHEPDRDTYGRVVLDRALAYAARGWPVVPLHSVTGGRCSCKDGESCKSKGKHPLTKHGLLDATTDRARICEWFSLHPNANVGILTGAASGIFVLDCDTKTNGPQTLAALMNQHGDLPATLVQDTGGGGTHHVLRYPADGGIKSRTNVAPGLDVRGDGGYIVVAPSVHESGRAYEFRSDPLVTEIAEAPPWLLQLCRQERKLATAPKSTAKQPPADPERVRDALRHVDANDRDTWLRVSAALKHDLGESGRVIWDEWSRTSPKFEQTGQDRTWASLGDHPDPASIGTIFHLAEQGGWDPRTKRGRRNSGSAPGAEVDVAGTFELTDSGNAERFASEWHARIKFSAGIGWLAWDGVRWTTGQGAEALVHRAARTFVKTLHREAASAAGSGAYAQLLARAKRAASRSGLDAILALASKDGRLLVHADALDADPLLLNCPNGIVDLQTGKLLPHDPKHLMTHLAGVRYDPDAKCPKWHQTLAEVFAGEDQDDVIDFVQRAVGYTLTGLTREEIFFMLFGDGRNGKGTLIDQIRKILGTYAQTATMALFLSQKHDSSKQFELAGLKGARMVVASEAGADRSFDTAVVKSFTGGDKRKACFKHKPHFEYVPTDKLWLQVNDKPKVPSWDTAFQERCRLLPFENQFTAEKGNVDRNRKTDLERELAGILAWAVHGCVRYLRDGLRSPERVRVAVEEYRTENTRVGEFLEQHFLSVPGLELLQSRVYAAYRNWCQSQGVRPVAENRLGQHLRDAGYDTRKETRGRVVMGIGVLDGVRLPDERRRSPGWHGDGRDDGDDGSR